jgi:hypothetical protein
MALGGRTRLIELAMVGVGSMLVAILGWQTVHRNPDVGILMPERGARWIRYPHGPRVGTRAAVDLETIFERSFDLASAPDRASLHIVAFRSAAARINGRPLDLQLSSTDWKRGSRIDVSPFLQAGTNRIEVAVVNDRGPPAVWLHLDADGTVAASDESWESSLSGATRLHAVAARDPMDAEPIDPEIARYRPGTALAQQRGLLAVFALLAGALVVGGEVVAWRLRLGPEERRRRVDRAGSAAVAAIVVVAWVGIAWNNAPSLTAIDGFDAEGHWQYVTFVMEEHGLPTADQGWSMFQPPLYYLLSAISLGVAGVATHQATAALIVRATSIALGALHLLFLFGSLRLIFPDRRGPVLAGLVIGAFIPAVLLQFQFVGNDALAMTLSAGAVYCTLLALRRETTSIALHAAVGIVLGLAMLAKASAVVPAAVVFLVLAAHAVAGGRVARDRLRATAVAGVTFVATCGWHFLAVWQRFGNPLAGNWDPRVLPAWWQDPGYLTPSFFTRWGASLREPLMSAYGSFWDGIYTTLWGDGLIAGRSGLWIAPPWDWERMAAGYVLALVPTVLIVLGAIVFVSRMVRRPGAVEGLIVGLGCVSGFALATWPLRLPIYSVIKASFILPATLSLAAFAGAGFAWVTSRSRVLRAVVLVAVGVWVLNVGGTFWIPRDGGDAMARLAWLEATGAPGSGGAGELFEGVLRTDPELPLSRLADVRRLESAGRTEEATATLRDLVADHPHHLRARQRLALLLESQGATEEAEAQFRRVVEEVPSAAVARFALGRLLAARGAHSEAVVELRRSVATLPELAEAHHELALALEGLGRHEEAAIERATAVRLARGPAARRDDGS